MPSQPAPTQTNAVIQNQTTGVVDFLKYQGHTLVSSSSHDYGLGSDFKIVASGDYGTGNELVAQSQSTGKLDFLKVDPTTGNLISSFMTDTALPMIHGSGYFNGSIANQAGNTLVSQTADGSIDLLAFDQNHKLIGSDLLAGTAGLPTLRGVGESYASYPQFAGVGDGNSDTLITQTADGTVDVIGFSGSFADGSLKYTASKTLSETKGSPQIYATNQNSQSLENIPSPGQMNQTEGVQLVAQVGTNIDTLYLDSGYGPGAQEGAFYASNLLPSFSGWNVVDGAYIENQLFPVVS